MDKNLSSVNSNYWPSRGKLLLVVFLIFGACLGLVDLKQILAKNEWIKSSTYSELTTYALFMLVFLLVYWEYILTWATQNRDVHASKYIKCDFVSLAFLSNFFAFYMLFKIVFLFFTISSITLFLQSNLGLVLTFAITLATFPLFLAWVRIVSNEIEIRRKEIDVATDKVEENNNITIAKETASFGVPLTSQPLAGFLTSNKWKLIYNDTGEASTTKEKDISFLSNGGIDKGKNKNENTWVTERDETSQEVFLYLYSSESEKDAQQMTMHSKFKYDPDKQVFVKIAGRDKKKQRIYLIE